MDTKPLPDTSTNNGGPSLSTCLVHLLDVVYQPEGVPHPVLGVHGHHDLLHLHRVQTRHLCRCVASGQAGGRSRRGVCASDSVSHGPRDWGSSPAGSRRNDDPLTVSATRAECAAQRAARGALVRGQGGGWWAGAGGGAPMSRPRRSLDDSTRSRLATVCMPSSWQEWRAGRGGAGRRSCRARASDGQSGRDMRGGASRGRCVSRTFRAAIEIAVINA